jgi:hypothetical protein
MPQRVPFTIWNVFLSKSIVVDPEKKKFQLFFSSIFRHQKKHCKKVFNRHIIPYHLQLSSNELFYNFSLCSLTDLLILGLTNTNG